MANSGRRSEGPFRSPAMVFLDRDGVINRKLPEGSYVRSWSDFHFLPGVTEAIRLLNRGGIRVVVVTNQRGISLGLYSETELGEIHRRMRQELSAHGASIDAIYYCPHNANSCNCRKPALGLYERALAEFPATPDEFIVVGDTAADMEAGARLGSRKALVSDGELANRLAEVGIHVDYCGRTLLQVVRDYILGNTAA